MPCKKVHLYRFVRLHICALMYDICFSLSDLLQSVWQSEVQPCLYKWPNFIPFYGWVVCHYIYVLHFLYPFVCQWAFRLFYDLAVVNSAIMNIGVHVSLWIADFSGCMSRSETAPSPPADVFWHGCAPRVGRGVVLASLGPNFWPFGVIPALPLTSRVFPQLVGHFGRSLSPPSAEGTQNGMKSPSFSLGTMPCPWDSEITWSFSPWGWWTIGWRSKVSGPSPNLRRLQEAPTSP